MKKFRISLLVFAFSAIVTVAFWAVLPKSWRVNESSDFTYFYEPVARQILNGRGATLPGGEPALRYPPGHPMLLAIVFGISEVLGMQQTTALAAWILLCTSLSSTLLFLLASQVFDLHTGLISAVLWITYPFQLWLTKQPNSEIPFTMLFFASVLLFWRGRLSPKRYWLSDLGTGFLAGLAALIRPIAIGLAPIYAVWLLGQRSLAWRARLVSSAILLAGFLVATGPWEAWVYAQSRQIIPLSSGGASSMWDGLTYALGGDQPASSRIPASAEALMINLMKQRSKPQAQSIGGLLSILYLETAQNPAGAFQLLGHKLARSWYGTESGRLEGLNLAVQAVYLLAIAWGGLALWQSKAAQRGYLLFAIVLTVYFWLMTVSALSILRYMVPVMGVLIPLIPAGILRCDKIKSALNQWLPIP
jgi:4-amino-4-deoxy-L-arabinose transferase-like glycosyltransferase